MTQVMIVCAAGASSTFLARRLSTLAIEAGLDWTVSPSPLETLDSKSADVVALTAHVATADVVESLRARGLRVLELPAHVSGAIGADDAVSAIVGFLGKDGGRMDSTVESAISEVTH